MLCSKKIILSIFISFCVAFSIPADAIKTLDIPITADKMEKIKTILKFPFYLKNHVEFNLSSIISSEFGMRFHPVLGRNKFHNGIDIRLRFEPVRSILLGKIKVTGYNKISGYYIIIEHLHELTTSYAHLSKIECSVGDIVLPGQEIGISGSSGRTTGPHLHFVVKFQGKAINPMILLKMIEERYLQGKE